MVPRSMSAVHGNSYVGYVASARRQLYCAVSYEMALLNQSLDPIRYQGLFALNTIDAGVLMGQGK